MNGTQNETVVVHGDWQCQFMDLAAHQKDCSDSNPNVCVVCVVAGKFFTGESIHDYYSTGHFVCLGLWALTVSFGTVGVFTNSLIIAVIRARKNYIPFDYLLMVLACLDIFCCITTIFAMSAHVARYQSWISHNEFAVYWFYVGNLLLLQGRTGSMYTTILITIERFLVIAFPIRSRSWFTSTKTTFFAVVAIFISFIPHFERYFCGYVEPNYLRDIKSLKDFQYLLRWSNLKFELPLPLHVKTFLRTSMEFWAPFPILLIFNGLSFLLVRKIPAKRRSMNVVQQKQIDALKMFTPVVSVLIVTNIMPIIHVLPILYGDTIYRELLSAFGLSVAVNSAVNFHIYYYIRPTFRKESKAVLRRWIGRTGFAIN